MGRTAYRRNRSRPVRFGGHATSPKRGGRPKKGRYRVNAHFAVLRIAFGAAAAVALFLLVNSALEVFNTTANVLAGK